MEQSKLIVLDPGHFHAALVQKEMYPWLSPHVTVYAPLGRDAIDYMARIVQFNTRPLNPTSWKIDLLTGPDFLERMVSERAGNVVVLSGKNRAKIDRIQASVRAALNVLADKPWIIRSEDLPKLEAALDDAERQGLIAYDIMTERYEITSVLQRELVMDEGIFGNVLEGSEAEPAVTASSIHHLMKLVAGTPIRRPAWFFDINEAGEGLADVGTHVVDLIQWTLFSKYALNCEDVAITGARRWPTVIPAADFERVTGETFPASVRQHVRQNALHYYCNNSVRYRIRGVHVALEILWNWEAPKEWGDVGDSYEATFRGTRSDVQIRHEGSPQLYVTPRAADVFPALEHKVADLQSCYPGLEIERAGEAARIVFPSQYRVGHEFHFAQVTNRFVEFLQANETLPSWEKGNMLVKYFITTKGVEAGKAETPAGD